MDNAVHGCDGGLSEVIMTELHCVIDLFLRVCILPQFCGSLSVAVLHQHSSRLHRGSTKNVLSLSFCVRLCHIQGADRWGVIIERSVKV